jgi:hypothetical protein
MCTSCARSRATCRTRRPPPPRPLFLEKRRIQQEDVSFTLEVDKLPAKAGLDPLSVAVEAL